MRLKSGLLVLIALIGFYAAMVRWERHIVARAFKLLPFSSEIIGPPKGIISAEEAAALPGATFIAIHSAEKDTVPLFPLAKVAQEKTNKALWSALPPEDFLKPTFVLVLPEARLYGQWGVVIANNDRVVMETFPFVGEKKAAEETGLFRKLRLYPVSTSNERIVVFADKSGNVYYHWMFDVLPRLELLRLSKVPYDKIYINAPLLPFQKETLKTLGIDESQIIASGHEVHLRAREVIIPSPPNPMFRISKWSCEFLRSHFLEAEQPKATRHIYISRKKAVTRRIINENEVKALLSQYGFEEVLLEDLSVKEQAKLFASAAIIVAPHGAGLTNLVFCQSGAHVVEIFSPTWIIDCFWRLGHQRGLDHHVMLAQSASLDSENQNNLDIKVDCEELKKIIDTMKSEDNRI